VHHPTLRTGSWIALGAVCVFATVCIAIAQQDGPVTEPRWTQLFNGEDLEGWATTGNAKWTVEDGIIVGQQDAGKVGDLWTEELFDNFELSVTFRMVWPGNSGIWFRCPPDAIGYQYDILDLKEYGCTVGTIYCQGFLSKNEDESIVNLEDWNTATIVADGPHITATLNGHPVADVTDEQFTDGRIGFQVHAGDHYKDSKIMVKEVKIRRILDDSEAQAAAKNEECYVCHIDYAKEEMTLTHQKQGVSCATCHGESKLHIDDEDRVTAPEHLVAHHRVAKFCRGCHVEIGEKCPNREKPKRGPDKACTECHGKHKLELGE